MFIVTEYAALKYRWLVRTFGEYIKMFLALSCINQFLKEGSSEALYFVQNDNSILLLFWWPHSVTIVLKNKVHLLSPWGGGAHYPTHACSSFEKPYECDL